MTIEQLNVEIEDPEIVLVTPVRASGCSPADCPPNAACVPNTKCNPYNCAPALKPCGPDMLPCSPNGIAPTPPRPFPRPPCFPGY